MTAKKYHDKKWLTDNLLICKSYQKLAVAAGVSPATIVKWLRHFDVFPVRELTDNYMFSFSSDSVITRFVLFGEPVIKKNSRTTRNGRPVPNAQYGPYADYNIPWLNKQWSPNIPLSEEMVFRCVFFRGTNRKVDISNLYEAPQDIMVKAGILLDDNSKIIVGHDGSRVILGSDEPRTEIYLMRNEQ